MIGNLFLPGAWRVALLLAAYFALLPAAQAQSSRCPQIVARIVSLEGRIETRPSGETTWTLVQTSTTFCAGDTVRVLERSRAGIVLSNDVLLRLDQNSVLTLGNAQPQSASVLELIEGWLHVITRHRKSFSVTTPFVNAVVEGTEFTVAADQDSARVFLTEGQVRMENAQGQLILTPGQAGEARAQSAPVPYTVLRPKDAVQWALYFPPVLRYRSAATDPTSRQAEDQAAQLALQGNVSEALQRLQDIALEARGSRLREFEASLLLAVGRAEEARTLLDQPEAGPASADGLALRAVLELTNGNVPAARALASEAVQAAPASAATLLARSYVEQADFDLDQALASARAATRAEADNPIAWARLAELELSVGEVPEATQAARRAIELSPGFGRGHTIAGFIELRRGNPKAALSAFETALIHSQADPMPRLGQGLAHIRMGELEQGRRDLEIAAMLDPNSALWRSYLGKAYFDERRDALAADQFSLAQSLDPNDPTPWFYDALRKQTENRPGEALLDLQHAQTLNGNRAVYRSRLLLDEDAAARSASLARLYTELGFNLKAQTEGLSAVNLDPASFSAHRFLADAYQPVPGYEIARVSELLQSQLLQPANAVPSSPRLGQSRAPILLGEGPSTPSFQEFNPLFDRDRHSFVLSGAIGTENTFTDELMYAVVRGNMGLRLGQFHYETDGFRPNANFEQDLYSVLYQNDLAWNTSFQLAFDANKIDNGDIAMRFDPDDFSLNRSDTFDAETFRVGARHTSSPGSDWLVSLIRSRQDSTQRDSTITDIPFGTIQTDSLFEIDTLTHMAELQYLRRKGRLHLAAGGGASYVERDDATHLLDTVMFPPLPPFPPVPTDLQSNSSERHQNLYAYGNWDVGHGVTAVTGLSFDNYVATMMSSNAGARLEIRQLNPKLGVLWQVNPDTALRAAAFRVLKRPFAANQTLEPTQVAGFNQLYDDINGTDSVRVGIGLDQRLNERWSAGLEASHRDLEVRLIDTQTLSLAIQERKEYLYRAYVSGLITPQISLSAEFVYEDQQRDILASLNDGFPHRVTTQLLPIRLTWHHPNGLFARATQTFVNQRVDDVVDATGALTGQRHGFGLFDFSIGYRFPGRHGTISLDVRNVFDREFGFQDTDFAGVPRIPLFQPGRAVFLRLNLYH